jgi:hypothetical protein
MKKDLIKKELIIRSLKILDIGYIATLYILSSLILTIIINKIFGKYDVKKDEKKSLFRLTIEIIFLTWMALIFGYIIRNIIEKIPSPFENIYGFNHKMVKEVTSASGYIMSIVTIASIYGPKFQYFGMRFSEKTFT